MKKNVFIAVNAAGPAGQGKLAGIFRYLKGSPDWNMTIVRHPTAFTPHLVRKAIANSCDGFIISTGEAEAAKRIIAKLDTPTVTVDMNDDGLWHNRKNIFCIRNSGDCIGQVGADFLISTGRCRSYAYIHFHLDDRIYDWDIQRFNSFQKRITEKDLICHDLHSPEGIQNLERPVGVLAANDEVAFATIQYCKGHRIRVPESAMIVGIDNDSLICESSVPKITSIQPDFESEGFLAAEMLDKMMHGEWKTAQPRIKTKFVGVRSIVCRNSTTMVSHAGKMVQKAIAYIHSHALNGINVNDVVHALGCSRRLADLRFRELQAMSIGQMIVNVKLDEARKMLLTTNDSIETIARDCGYANVTHLKNLFKRRFKQTMNDCRKNVCNHT